MENVLSDQGKFQETALKDDNFLNFITKKNKKQKARKKEKQEKQFHKIYKNLVDLSEKTRRHLKPVGTRPRIMYSSRKVHKNVSMAIHLSDQFYLLYKHLHTSFQRV